MNTADTSTLSVHDDVPEDAEAIVDAGLGASNRSAAPSLQDVAPLACIARAADGRVLGGAIGRTWGHCCELQQLWVEPAQRRRGLGARLVRGFEARAEARGCSTFYLETFSFQAPALYRSLGYEIRLELRGYTGGVVKYTMLRDAPPGPG